ncbi:MAG TPA: hypothetical protein VKE96_15795 [Vicinamibacterales bacterium]|nr:hypothetical protein [Vicinamibacterales bacterium]
MADVDARRVQPRRRCCRRAIAAALFACAVPGRLAAQTMDHDAQPPSHPEVVVHAFGSVDWGGTTEPDTPNSFALGQLALFATSAINDRVSVLAEVVLEASAATTEVTTDVERLQLTYRLNDHLNISAGRYHTGIGYYNAAFHHGSYFETTIGRPRIFAFEDLGGVLPIHELGVSARGIVPRTGSAVRYVAEVGNGRRWTDVEDEKGLDQNKAKSTNFGLSLRPERWHGAEIGGSFYRDDIPDQGGLAVKNQIVDAYGVYRTPAVELMAEWLRLSYRHETSGPRYDNHGGYLQASRAFGKIRPYYRYDRLDVDPGTPFIGTFPSSETHEIGARFDPAAWVGLKAQYERLHTGDHDPANGMHVQLVFVF